jgi:A/G-specific adenine glycosylase
VFGIDTDISSGEGKIQFSALANKLIDKERPDLFNQALMEFGALHCLPKNPKCDECIFAKRCEARQKNLQSLLPVKAKKLKVRARYFYYFVIKYNSKILMKERTEKDIWSGLYDFYLVEKSRPAKVKALHEGDELLSAGTVVHESKSFVHLLSHQKLNVKFVVLEIPASKARDQKFKKLSLTGYTRKKISELPKPILIDRYLKSDQI